MPIIKPRHKKRSAQSAMEYLMTYGWAILIIAVVLAALFELGVFNGSNLAPQACIAQAGFVCRNPVYTANGIGITFGQTTGREYFYSFLFIAAEGEPLNSSGIPQNFSTANALFIGNLTPGQTIGADFNASKFAYGQIPANAPIGTPFAGYVWLGYCLSPCSAPTAYSKVATITAKEAGTSSSAFGGYLGGGSGVIITTTTTTTTTTSSTSTTTICSVNDPTSGYDQSCNVVFTKNEGLSGDILTTGSITINSGVTLTSDGHIFVAGGTFDNLGTLNTGFLNGSFIPVAQRGNYAFPNSFGGSGGGGGDGCSSSPFSGQNTQAPGGSAGSPAGSAGSTPSPPAMSNSNIQTWYANGFSNYLSGAAGGGASNTNYVAGGGAGTYIQANTLIAGTINAMGGDSQACPVSGGNTNDPMGAGGGGGTIMLTYGPGGYTQGTYNVNGGYGGDWGANGGNGQVATYQWSTAPILP